MPIALYQRVPLQRCTTQPPLQNIPSTLVLAHPNIVPTVSTRSVASQRWRRRARRCFSTWPLQRVSFNPFILPLRSARSIGDVTFASDAAGTRSASPGASSASAARFSRDRPSLVNPEAACQAIFSVGKLSILSWRCGSIAFFEIVESYSGTRSIIE